MNVFRNLKISYKLGFLVLVSLIGFAAIGVMYFTVSQLQNQAEQEAVSTQSMVFGVDTLNNQIAAVRRQAQSFFDSPEAAKVEQTQIAIAKLGEQLSSFEQLAEQQQEAESGETLIRLRSAVTELAATFELASATRTAIGFNQDLGVQGEMRTVVNSLEEELSKKAPESSTVRTDAQVRETDNLKLNNLMLMLRRHEKDYIQREDDQYIEQFSNIWGLFKEKLVESVYSATEQENMIVLIDGYFEKFLTLVEATQKYNDEAAAFIAQEENITALTSEIVIGAQGDLEQGRTSLATEIETFNQIFVATLSGVALVVILAVILIGGSLFGSVRRLQSAVQRVAAGDLSARAEMNTGDELGQLGAAFNNMLDERLADLERQAKEKEQLDDSVITLMEAADRLSKRDLTVRVPVGEDATGNISDALNMMTAETARVMGEINSLAAQLEQAATVVQNQGEKVAQVASTEREVVSEALQALEQSSDTMTEMAELAESSNELAENTSNSTKRALGAVRKTVQSMNEIRSTVSETEKSIKRLGERSQEIGSIVEIIKGIAERTHTLALNAGMQAVAAGEAGRGFSVVADEVQRLAETARESTEQIAGLVQSIQAESSETMTTMNKTISQVVEGSELTERSGKRMRVTMKATQDLVNAVQQIAERSKSLVTINESLRAQATQLQESTQATEQQIAQQTKQTQGMFNYLKDLVKSVRVFKLPEAA